MTATLTATSNPYLDHYNAQLAHQRQHDPGFGIIGMTEQPSRHCSGCLRERRIISSHDWVRRFSWAVPNNDALDAIAEHSPNGVVEIGAGGGYWAGLLRARGVDVVAYDPDPVGSPDREGGGAWHDGTRWSDVQHGDHTAVTAHPDRTLLLVWPSYDEAWTDQVIDLYAGDTVIYVGEGGSGCTGTGRMHALLGEPPYCWHGDVSEPEDCTCGKDPALFREAAVVDIPQWAGLHDRLHVYKRISA